ncbi:MAG TPA: VOC family protein [Acidobacteriota bacterium]|nr:VOC family protein [Acidobacteriota bacterium]
MKLKRIDHVGINVEDFQAAKAFFFDIGFKETGKAELEGKWLDKIVDLKGVKSEFIFLKPTEGETTIELIKYHSPSDAKGIQKSQANTLGIRHICLAVENIDGIVAKLKKKGIHTFSEIYNYQGVYKLVYIRGPEGIIVELAEQIN